jgi:hypothetical protein
MSSVTDQKSRIHAIGGRDCNRFRLGRAVAVGTVPPGSRFRSLLHVGDTTRPMLAGCPVPHQYEEFL